MRLFVAIEMPPDIRERITSYVSLLKPRLANARCVRPEGMHITLKFLGNIADEKRQAIESTLRKVRSPSFELSLENVGMFPNARSPRVLWVGINSGPELAALAAQVDLALATVGFAREKRAFTPHVTLARFKEGGKKQHVSSPIGESDLSFGTMAATEFHLYESKPSPEAARYSKLVSFPLK
jgi:2'-5' RNA ligase